MMSVKLTIQLSEATTKLTSFVITYDAGKYILLVLCWSHKCIWSHNEGPIFFEDYN